MIPYIDFHCDTLMRAWELGASSVNVLPEAMVDTERLEKGGCLAQFFAVFMMPQPKKPDSDDDAYIDALLRIFHASQQGELAFAGNLQDYRRNRETGKISGFLTLEDGRKIIACTFSLEKYMGMAEIPLGTQLELTFKKAKRSSAIYIREVKVLAEECPTP